MRLPRTIAGRRIAAPGATGSRLVTWLTGGCRTAARSCLPRAGRTRKCLVALLAWSLSTSALALSNLTIDVSPTSASTGLEAGNIARFDITVRNTGNTPAFDVVVTDTPPAEFFNCQLNGTSGGAGAGDPFAGGYTFTNFAGITPNGLDPNDTVVLDVQCNLVATVQDSSTYANQASVVWADSIGGAAFPAVNDSGSVSTRALVTTKTIIATSEAHTT